MACCKISIIVFLRRAVGSKRYITVILAVLGISVILWAITVVAYTTFVCTPVSYYWNKAIHDGRCLSQATYRGFNITTAVIGAATDIALFILPMPTLWQLKLKSGQKVALMFVFGVGLAYAESLPVGVRTLANTECRVCSFSILRVVQFIYFDTSQLSSKHSFILSGGTFYSNRHRPASSVLESLWTVLENEFSIICGCAPQLAPLFKSLRSAKEKLSGYSASYNTSILGMHAKMSDIRTTVRGRDTGAKVQRPTKALGRQNSSEIELQGIEVHTAIDQEISTGVKGDGLKLPSHMGYTRL